MFSRISILVDNDSWILPYAQQLIDWLTEQQFHSQLVRNQLDIPCGDICFFLGCTKLVEEKILTRNALNLVVHESALPKGKGFAPMAWQILAGETDIPICLIEATTQADAGDIWLIDSIRLSPNDLASDWREKQGQATIHLIQRFIQQYPNLSPQKQQGESTFYARRTPEDSELDINKTIKEQFELLRVVDNKDYPAFFTYQGTRYRLEIYKDE